MSAHLRKKEERIQQLIECLSDESIKGTPIIVEGKHDVQTLRLLGIEGKVISAKTGGKSLQDVISEIEETASGEVILLFDFDRRGKEWLKSVRQNLEKSRIKANTLFWEDLLGLAGRELKDIEGLQKYLETLKRKIGEA